MSQLAGPFRDDGDDTAEMILPDDYHGRHRAPELFEPGGAWAELGAMLLMLAVLAGIAWVVTR